MTKAEIDKLAKGLREGKTKNKDLYEPHTIQAGESEAMHHIKKDYNTIVVLFDHYKKLQREGKHEESYIFKEIISDELSLFIDDIGNLTHWLND